MRRVGVLVIALFMLACDSVVSESNVPIFPLDPPGGQPTFDLLIDSKISPEVIKPSKIRRFVRQIVGWIPLVGDVFELPMDLVNALLPDLKFDDILDMPGDASLEDPNVMKDIELIEIEQMQLKITPESERGPGYKRERCYLVLKCKDQDLKFMKEIIIAIEDIKNQKSWILAKGSEKDLSDENRLLTLRPARGMDLRPFLQNVDQYKVSVVVNGRVPKRTLYIEGSMKLRVRLAYGETFADEDRK